MQLNIVQAPKLLPLSKGTQLRAKLQTEGITVTDEPGLVFSSPDTKISKDGALYRVARWEPRNMTWPQSTVDAAGARAALLKSFAWSLEMHGPEWFTIGALGVSLLAAEYGF